MRKILFRGKQKDNNKWIYGDLIHIDKQIFITPTNSWCDLIHNEACILDIKEVIPETVGQFTGLIAEKCKSNLGKRIFEGDIFRNTKETDEGDVVGYSVVVWLEKYAAYYFVPSEHYEIIINNDVFDEKEFSWLFDEALLRDFSIDIMLTKVGNVFDNKDLI